MSTAKRIISGSAASWLRIFINLGTQLALVPVYLTHWSVGTYGLWIATQALINILSMIDLGHQNFLGFEFLRVGSSDRLQTSKIIWSGALFGFFIGLFQIFLIFCFIWLDILHLFIDNISLSAVEDVNLILIVQGITWMISGSIGGVLVRALYPFGYLPRMSWWGVWAAIITSVAPVVAVILGANLLAAGIVLSASTIFYNIPLYIDIIKILRKENISFLRPSLSLGFKNLTLSLALVAKGLCENFRAQGVRIVLAPLAGTNNLVAFTTMRTGANIVLQGLSTITNPIMPELMRFLNSKDQSRTNATFGTVWLVLVFFLSPGVVVLQMIVEPLYVIWTRGHVKFDPLLFATLSEGVLVFALAQPAIAIVTGNNLLRPQLFISAISAGIVVIGIVVLVPYFGILGAGFSLLLAEIIDTNLYKRVAGDWLLKNELNWPRKLSQVASISVLLSFVISLLIIYLPDYRWVSFLVGLICMYLNARRYWLIMPDFVAQRVKKMFMKIPILKNILPYD